MEDMANELLSNDSIFQNTSFENYTLWKENITEILKEIEKKKLEEEQESLCMGLN